VNTAEGINGAVRYGSSKKLTLPLTGEEQKRLQLEIGVASKVKAPVADGQPIGVGRVMLDGREIGEFPVVSLEADGKKHSTGILRKLLRVCMEDGQGGIRLQKYLALAG